MDRAVVLIGSWLPLKAANYAQEAKTYEEYCRDFSSEVLRFTGERELLRLIEQRGEVLSSDQRRRPISTP